MKIAAISDAHGFLPTIDEDVELLLIGGDISPTQIQGNITLMKQWITNEFVEWVNNLPVKKVIMIAGNHDFYLRYLSPPQKLEFEREFNGKLKYIENEYYEYLNNNGDIIKIFGTPYCKIFGNWPFMLTNEELAIKYDKIPFNLDILLSHDSPALGTVGTILEDENKINAGNYLLAEEILLKEPKHCFSEHIHSGNHNMESFGNTKAVNVSLLDESYTPTYEIFYLDI